MPVLLHVLIVLPEPTIPMWVVSIHLHVQLVLLVRSILWQDNLAASIAVPERFQMLQL